MALQTQPQQLKKERVSTTSNMNLLRKSHDKELLPQWVIYDCCGSFALIIIPIFLVLLKRTDKEGPATIYKILQYAIQCIGLYSGTYQPTGHGPWSHCNTKTLFLEGCALQGCLKKPAF